jgi:hypothetical protein
VFLGFENDIKKEPRASVKLEVLGKPVTSTRKLTVLPVSVLLFLFDVTTEIS